MSYKYICIGYLLDNNFAVEDRYNGRGQIYFTAFKVVNGFKIGMCSDGINNEFWKIAIHCINYDFIIDGLQEVKKFEALLSELKESTVFDFEAKYIVSPDKIQYILK